MDIIIDKKHHKDLTSYCKLNDITDINDFVNKCFKSGFDTKRYGLIGNTPEVKTIEIEVIKEVPVEVIKEVEKIVEVPGPVREVEVIKEVEKIVIKEVFIQDSVPNLDNIWDKDKLLETIQGLEDDKQRLSTKIGELTKELSEFSVKTEETAKIFQDNQKSLQTTLLNLRKELKLKDEKISELENKLTTPNADGQRAIYMNGSNIKQTL
jgi:hypothetical protein